MSGVELLPCPFCGKWPIEQDPFFSHINDPAKIDPNVFCLGHTALMPRTDWNTRTTPAQPLDAATIERCAQVAETVRLEGYATIPGELQREQHRRDTAAAIRALAASTTTREEDARLREALEEIGQAYERWDPDATFATTALSQVAAKARAALQGDAEHTSQEKPE